MRRRHDGGFTLLELMIVVVIVGVLVAIAVFMYQRWMRKAEASEVNYVFGEFRIKQEKFALENRGRYRSSDVDEDTRWPDPMGGQDLTAWDDPATPGGWRELGISLDRAGLHCSYVSVAGLADDDTNIGAKALEFGFTAPAINWYYTLAECDFDGRATKNSFYFQPSNLDQIQVENPGF